MYKAYEEFNMSQRVLWVGNINADKGEPGGRDIQTGLADRFLSSFAQGPYIFKFHNSFHG
jgi:hypothetical protein